MEVDAADGWPTYGLELFHEKFLSAFHSRSRHPRVILFSWGAKEFHD
jgi:hypothetical protein